MNIEKYTQKSQEALLAAQRLARTACHAGRFSAWLDQNCLHQFDDFLALVQFFQLNIVLNGLSLWRGGDAQETLRPPVVDEARNGGEQHSPAA